MSGVPFLVSACDKNSIASIIKECFGAEFPDISNKKQIIYLLNYLTKLKAETVVCETNYIDKDWTSQLLLVENQTSSDSSSFFMSVCQVKSDFLHIIESAQKFLST